MSFEIQYKCYMGFHSNFGEPSTQFPMLKIRYRKSGCKLWEKLDKMEVDTFAFSFYHREYYTEFREYLGDESDYTRLTTFQKVLSDRFDGSLERYVKIIVEAEVVMKLANIDEQNDSESIAQSLLTNGWNSTTIEIE